VVAPMPGLRRGRALVHPAQVFASPAFGPWPGGVVLAARHLGRPAGVIANDGDVVQVEAVEELGDEPGDPGQR
jgi:hypothetical protein